jgi:hypothetical protein
MRSHVKITDNRLQITRMFDAAPQETIVTLAGLARFIIADITDPKSVPQELVKTVESLPSVPVQPLLHAGYEPWEMYDHVERYPWVLPLVKYENQRSLLRAQLFRRVLKSDRAER